MQAGLGSAQPRPAGGSRTIVAGLSRHARQIPHSMCLLRRARGGTRRGDGRSGDETGPLSSTCSLSVPPNPRRKNTHGGVAIKRRERRTVRLDATTWVWPASGYRVFQSCLKLPALDAIASRPSTPPGLSDIGLGNVVCCTLSSPSLTACLSAAVGPSAPRRGCSSAHLLAVS
jgi:hypothetical protein